MNGERRPVGGLEPHAGKRGQRGYVLDLPTAKCLECVSKRKELIPTGALG